MGDSLLDELFSRIIDEKCGSIPLLKKGFCQRIPPPSFVHEPASLFINIDQSFYHAGQNTLNPACLWFTKWSELNIFHVYCSSSNFNRHCNAIHCRTGLI